MMLDWGGSDKVCGREETGLKTYPCVQWAHYVYAPGRGIPRGGRCGVCPGFTWVLTQNISTFNSKNHDFAHDVGLGGSDKVCGREETGLKTYPCVQ